MTIDMTGMNAFTDDAECIVVGHNLVDDIVDIVFGENLDDVDIYDLEKGYGRLRELTLPASGVYLGNPWRRIDNHDMPKIVGRKMRYVVHHGDVAEITEGPVDHVDLLYVTVGTGQHRRRLPRGGGELYTNTGYTKAEVDAWRERVLTSETWADAQRIRARSKTARPYFGKSIICGCAMSWIYRTSEVGWCLQHTEDEGETPVPAEDIVEHFTDSAASLDHWRF